MTWLLLAGLMFADHSMTVEYAIHFPTEQACLDATPKAVTELAAMVARTGYDGPVSITPSCIEDDTPTGNPA